MRIAYLVPPGRVPTVIIDPGTWWDVLARSGRHELVGYSANFHWWRNLCRPAIKDVILSHLTGAQRLRRRLEWRVAELDLAATADAAGRMLEALRDAGPCPSAGTFLDGSRRLAEHLQALNDAQGEIEFSLSPGMRVRNVNYDDSQALLQCARHHPLLAKLVHDSLTAFPADVDFLAVSVTSAESLLTAMAAVRLLRERSPHMHCCLADHGYENFSLHAHMETLRATKALEQLFDTIIEAKDDRDALLPQIVDAAGGTGAPRGFVKLKNGVVTLRPAAVAAPASKAGGFAPPSPLPTLTPEPVLFTRLSRRRCYWSRCTFCTQNTKYDDPKAASRQEVPESLERLAAYVDAGYRNIVFSDEAISPATLRVLSEEILKRGLRFQWTCRCRLELTHTRELFERMRAAGCYEILFGLESISTRVQMLMDKHVEGMDEARVRKIFDDLRAAGLGVHVTMIAGFPGDTLADSERTVDFVVEALREARNATFYLNRFSLLPDTIILREPQRFGVTEVLAKGDMPSQYAFTFDPAHGASEEAAEDYARLREKLVQNLGWKCLGPGAAGKAAQLLYFTSGWGAMFKTQTANPFANPLLQPPVIATTAAS